MTFTSNPTMNTTPKTITLDLTVSEILYLKTALVSLENNNKKLPYNEVISNKIFSKIKTSMTMT